MTKFNLGGWTFTIKCADGTYNTTTGIAATIVNGSGLCALQGNTANPRNCLIK